MNLNPEIPNLPTFISIFISIGEEQKNVIFSENRIKINSSFLKKHVKTIGSLKTANFFDSFLEIHKEPYFLNITSTLSEAIYYQTEFDESWKFMFPFENIIINLNETIAFFYEDIICQISLIINPDSNIENFFLKENKSFEILTNNEENFWKDCQKFNDDLNSAFYFLNVQNKNFQENLEKFCENQNNLFYDDESAMINFTKNFIKTQLEQHNIKIDWVKKIKSQNESEIKQNDLSSNSFDEFLENNDNGRELSQAEFANFIRAKSKSKQKMVLRERKKMSFIQFFMSRSYNSHNTHMKRYKKVLDKNNNKLDEICVICLDKICKTLGKISCCHIFCFECIKDWAQVTNSCPLCKKEFSEINQYSLENKLIFTEKVQQRKQMISDDISFYDNFIDDTDESCYVCNMEVNPELLLVCDQCNFFCCHTYCESPPLESVPLEEWFCSKCREENQETNDSLSENEENFNEILGERRYLTRGLLRSQSQQTHSKSYRNMSLRPRRR